MKKRDDDIWDRMAASTPQDGSPRYFEGQSLRARRFSQWALALR
jgi:hypothetical protein